MTRDLYPNSSHHRHRRGQPGPSTEEILDALHRLVTACQADLGSKRAGSPGWRVYWQAVNGGEELLKRSRKYGEVEP